MTERQNSPICSSIPQVPSIAGAGSGQSWEPAVPLGRGLDDAGDPTTAAVACCLPEVLISKRLGSGKLRLRSGALRYSV